VFDLYAEAPAPSGRGVLPREPDPPDRRGAPADPGQLERSDCGYRRTARDVAECMRDLLLVTVILTG
jgi:hypothetical protein